MDNLLARLISDQVEVVRVGHGRAIHPGVLGHVLDGERYPCDSLEAVEKLVERVPVVGATCYGKVGVVVPTGLACTAA